MLGSPVLIGNICIPCRRYGLSRKEEGDKEKDAKKKAVAAGLGGEEDEERLKEEEEARIQALMSGMAATGQQVR